MAGRKNPISVGAKTPQNLWSYQMYSHIAGVGPLYGRVTVPVAAKINVDPQQAIQGIVSRSVIQSQRSLIMQSQSGRWLGSRREMDQLRPIGDDKRAAWDKRKIDAIYDLRDTAQEESTHKKIILETNRWVPSTDLYTITLRCHECGTTWTHQTMGSSMPAPDDIDGQDRWLRESLIPWGAKIIESERCWSTALKQQIAEHLTRRLAEAGKKGVPYHQLVEELISGDLSGPAPKVDALIRDMKMDMTFVPVCPLYDWTPMAPPKTRWQVPVLLLPEGHPLRDW